MRVKTEYVLICLIISIILVNSWPLWTGNEFEEDARVKEIPSYWYEAADWMNSLNKNFTYFCLPQQYFSVYTWGKTLGNEKDVFFKSPQISMRGGVSGDSPQSTALIDFIYDGLSKNSSQDFGRILGLMNVEYILQRNDINWTYYNFVDSPSYINFVDSPSYIRSVLSSQRGIHLEKTFGELDFYKINYTMPLIYASDNAVYVEGGIDSLIQLASFYDFPMFSSVLFFSEVMPEQNNLTLPLANQVVYKSIEKTNESNAIFYEYNVELRNSDATTVRFEHNPVNNGKFFESGARGYIDAVKVYAENNATSEGVLTLGFAEYPGSPELFETDVSVPAASYGWFNATVDRFWDFDSIFIYIKFATAWVGVDYDKPDLWDNYYSTDGVNWSKYDGRNYISLEYTRTLVLAPVKNNSISEPPEIVWQELNPTKHLVDVNAENPFFLVFSQMYHDGWKAYIDGEEVKQHFLANGYANSWYVNRTGSFRIVLEYTPQQPYDLAKAASLLTFVILAVAAIFPLRHKMKQKINHFKSARDCKIDKKVRP